jgi:UDP-glucose-4-epimerase GalE
MSDKPVLVTGGAGYVGSHVCLALAEAGYRPISYDNLSRGYRWAVQFGPLEEGDIGDRERLAEVFAKQRPIAVLHFAALTYVGESVSDPAMYWRTNVAGTLSLIEAMREADVRNIVFSSTAAVYGAVEVSPIPETAPLAPINPYGASKLAMERMLGDFVAAYGFHAAALRYFNAAGADPDGRIGEAHDPETHLIPLVLDAAIGRRDAISVFGDSYPTPDGTCIRDYIHVLDLAQAHVAALERLLGGGDAEFLALNLGTGSGASVREVIDAARRVTGRTIAERAAPRREGDPAVLVADPTLAKTTLGWTARRSSLEQQMRDAWNWHLKRFGAVPFPETARSDEVARPDEIARPEPMQPVSRGTRQRV